MVTESEFERFCITQGSGRAVGFRVGPARVHGTISHLSFKTHQKIMELSSLRMVVLMTSTWNGRWVRSLEGYRKV